MPAAKTAPVLGVKRDLWQLSTNRYIMSAYCPLLQKRKSNHQSSMFIPRGGLGAYEALQEANAQFEMEIYILCCPQDINVHESTGNLGQSSELRSES